MSRAPYFEMSYNGKPFDELGVTHLVESVEFVEDVDKFDQVVMVINEGPGLERATDLTRLGSVMQLSMGYINEGILPMTVVFLNKYAPDFVNQQVTLTFTGYLKAMDVSETDRQLANKTLLEVVTEVLNDYNVLEVGTIENGDVLISDTTTQSKKTDFSLLEGLASQFGMKWKVEPSEDPGKWLLSLYKLEYDKSTVDQWLPIHCYPEKDYQDDRKSLKLKNFKPESNILGVSSRVEIRSNNPNQPISVETLPKDDNVDQIQMRGSEVVAAVFGQVTRVHFYENVSNEEAASIIAEQLQQQDELAFVSAKDCQLNEGIPNARVGQVRQVVPRGIALFDKVFTGPYLITGSKHRIAATSGYDTWLTMNMNALSIPMPEAHGLGGGGLGQPVWIKVYSDNSMEGWYMSQSSDGTMIRGSHITEAQILANEYWMERVRASTYIWISPTNLDPSTPMPPIPIIAVGSNEASAFQSITPFMVHSNIPASGYFRNSATDVYIDFPESWTSSEVGLTRSVHAGDDAQAPQYEGISGFFQQKMDQAEAAYNYQPEFEGFLNGMLNQASGLAGNND